MGLGNKKEALHILFKQLGSLTHEAKICRECLDKPDLFSEDYAVLEALTHFEGLDYQGADVKIWE